MHLPLSTFLLALLPSIVVADQVPLKEKAGAFLDKAKQYIPSGVANPAAAAAAVVAGYKVEKINMRNFERKLGPKPDGEEEWMIFMTGGNKSCIGRCERADLKWNESVPILATLPKIPNSELHLGTINCEVEEVLCTRMATSVPAIHYYIFPQHIAGQPKPLSPFYEILLNMTKVEVSSITDIPRASKSSYLQTQEYTGAFHPFDGWLAKFGLQTPLGYVLWGFSVTPTWLVMIGISFVSRQMMANRAGRRVDAAKLAGQQPPAAAAPAAAPPRPAAAAAAGNKKRK